MNSLAMDAELVSTCNALGTLDKNTKKFVMTEDCAHCLRDLLRFIKRDTEDNNFSCRRQLGSLNIVTSKLIPMLKDHCAEDEDLFDVILRLLVSLTNPTLLLFKEKKPENKEHNQLYLEMTMFLYDYKLAFGDNMKCWSILAKHLGRILGLDWENRQEEHKLMLERILILIRNLLHIPLAPSLEKTTDDEANPQDRIIELMKDSGIAELVLFIADSDEETDYCFHVLEIASLMLREQKPEFLAKMYKERKNEPNETKRSQVEKDIDKQQFEATLARERTNGVGRRPYYSRFKEATYQVKNVKSLGENDTIIHKTPTSLDSGIVPINSNKQGTRRAKNRRALTDDVFSNDETTGFFHRSTPKVQKVLGHFCTEFLGSYNSLMKIVRYNLSRKLNQDNDESYYLWACQFFMEFNRYTNVDINPVMETFSVEAFYYIHSLMMNYMDALKLEKKMMICILWSRRLHFAIKAYREFIFSVHFAYASDKYQIHDLAKEIKSRVFYQEDYRDLMLLILKDFNEVKMTKLLLKDLIETNHIFLHMLQKYCLVNDIVVAKTTVKASKRKEKGNKKVTKKKRKVKVTKKSWLAVVETLDPAFYGFVDLPTAEENADVLPMDTALDFDPDVQKLSIMKRLRKMLISKRGPEAVALYRNAREAWSDDPELPFGSSTVEVAEERDGLKEIYFSGLDIDEDDEQKAENSAEVVINSEQGDQDDGPKEADGITELHQNEQAAEAGQGEEMPNEVSKKKDDTSESCEDVPKELPADHIPEDKETEDVPENAENDSGEKEDGQEEEDEGISSEKEDDDVPKEKPEEDGPDHLIDIAEDDEAAEEVHKSKNLTFQFDDFVKKYCTKAIIKAYATMLKSYRTNSAETNRCVLKMLHRIAVDCSMYAMFFQASIFLVFQKILNDPSGGEHDDLSKFAKFIVKKFVTTMSKNENLLIELLFWKSNREAYGIEEGFQD